MSRDMQDTSAGPGFGASAAMVPFEDDDIAVAFKPVGMSVDAADREQGADLITALRARGAAGDQAFRAQLHLDRDVSGLVVFTRNPAATKRMAAGEPIRTTFVVAASARSRREASGVLRGWLVRRGGRAEVQLHKSVGATPVQAEVRTRARRSDRCVIEVRSTASARHVRALLAAHGLPVAGDVARGGARWHRVMLHVSEVAFVHPSTGRRDVVGTDDPWEMGAWLDGDVRGLGRERGGRAFEQAARARTELARVSDAYRLFHGEGEGLPGVDLDRFGDYLVLWTGEELSEKERGDLLDAAWSFGPRGLYTKVRPRAASRLDEGAREALAPSAPYRGEAAQSELVVREHGLSYLVRLDDGLATGLFLDQRGNRQWLREQAKGATVLNLFAYTCAFTVAAAAGGAEATVSVDISARALETGRRNLQLGGLDSGRHELVRDDVMRWVAAARAKARRFDVVVLDPPSFGTTKHGRFSAEDDYGALATEVVHLVGDRGGVLLACTNHRGVTMKRFRGWLEAAVTRAGRGLGGLKEAPAGLDFPVPAGGEPHMKAVRVWVAPK